MADLELIQDRTLSGKGVLKIPSDVKKLRYAILYADVIRKPKNEYLNFAYNPPRGRYGTLVFLRNSYVVDTQALEYPRQSFDGIADISGQTLIAVKCAYDGILDTFVNLSVALGATPGGVGLVPISKVNNIKDYENLLLSWDEVRFVAYADTAVQLRLYRKRYDVCNDDFDKQDPPPPPPPPKPPVPPGTPITDLSPPYDSGSSDNGNTSPYPDDVSPPPIPSCSVVRISVSISLQGYPGTYDTTYRVFTEYGGLRVSPTNPTVVEAYCQGSAIGACQPNASWQQVDSVVAPITNIDITGTVYE